MSFTAAAAIQNKKAAPVRDGLMNHRQDYFLAAFFTLIAAFLRLM